jgi:hypothetical protein
VAVKVTPGLGQAGLVVFVIDPVGTLGTGVMERFDEELTVPAEVVTEIRPEVAAAGTVMVMEVALIAVMVAAVPLTDTLALTLVPAKPRKPVPVMLTLLPEAHTPAGVKLLMVGAGMV